MLSCGADHMFHLNDDNYVKTSRGGIVKERGRGEGETESEKERGAQTERWSNKKRVKGCLSL